MSAPTLAPTGATRRSGWSILGQIVSLVLTVALVALVTAVFIAPRLMGGASLTVLSGSMRPTLQPGDVAVVRGVDKDEVCSSVGIGHIVTFMPNPNDAALITHRVVSKTVGSFDDGTACRLITKGDANSAVDQPVSPVQVRGVFLYNIPKLGWVRQWAAQNMTLVLIGGAVAVVGYLVWSYRRPRLVVVETADQVASEPALEASQSTPRRSLDDYQDGGLRC